jgi:hypothetical protein
MSSETQPTAGPAALAVGVDSGRRAGYGLLWTAWTIVLTIAGFALLGHGSVVSGLLGLALAALALRYAWRIWTWQAKRLIFFIVF